MARVNIGYLNEMPTVFGLRSFWLVHFARIVLYTRKISKSRKQEPVLNILRFDLLVGLFINDTKMEYTSCLNANLQASDSLDADSRGLFLDNTGILYIYMYKLKQSHYRSGVAQRVPGS